MTFKPAVWYPISLVLSVVNVASAWFAAQAAEPWHATIHATLAVAFAAWAQRLRRGPRRIEGQAELEELEGEIDSLRLQLNEANERLDFAERILAQQDKPRERVE